MHQALLWELSHVILTTMEFGSLSSQFLHMQNLRPEEVRNVQDCESLDLKLKLLGLHLNYSVNQEDHWVEPENEQQKIWLGLRTPAISSWILLHSHQKATFIRSMAVAIQITYWDWQLGEVY
jgi:hypothetical protein